VFTDAPVVLGTDGARKMSKSAGNTIPIFAEPDQIQKIVMSMVTDPLRIKRTDPGRPEVCNVCQLHRFFGGDYLQIQDGERTARTGCVETKQLLADRIIEFFRPMREKRAELAADPDLVERVLAAGAEKVRPILAATLEEVRTATGTGPRRASG
jgi:tryptophanyl-tRNA synthetase